MSEDRPRAGLRRAAAWLVRLAFLAAVVWVIASRIDRRRVVEVMGRMGLLPFVLCAALDVTFVLVESVRIGVLARGRYRYPLIVRSRYLSTLISILLPGVAAADLVRMIVMDRVAPGNKTGILVLLLGSRVYGLLSLVTLGLIALGQPVGATLLERWPSWVAIGLAGGLAAMASPLLVQLERPRAFVLRLFRLGPRGLAEILSRATAALVDITRPRQWAVAVTTSTITNFITALQFWIMARAAGAEVPLGTWCLLTPLVAVLTLLPLGLGAVGTQEAALYAAARLLDVPFEPLLIVSFSMHLLRIVGFLPGLFFFGDLVEAVRVLRKDRGRLALAPEP